MKTCICSSSPLPFNQLRFNIIGLNNLPSTTLENKIKNTCTQLLLRFLGLPVKDCYVLCRPGVKQMIPCLNRGRPRI